MRTAELEEIAARSQERREYADKLEASVELANEEKRILSESLDRSKAAIAAVIEQREELARRIREGKR